MEMCIKASLKKAKAETKSERSKVGVRNTVSQAKSVHRLFGLPFLLIASKGLEDIVSDKYISACTGSTYESN
mgnify:CR=1 FL=1